MARKSSPIRLPAPYLRRVTLDVARVANWNSYPFCLPLFHGRTFDFAFEKPVTIIVGENGSGKSTLLEAIAVFAGFDPAGGGSGYRLVDHSKALEGSGGELASALRAQWLPKITSGWFFRAESFFSIARYLDEAALDASKWLPTGPPPDFLSHSHGEGFLRFFAERANKRGLYIFDEPESALSPTRQIEFLKLLRAMELEHGGQIIIATHAPILMAYPGAQLVHLTKYGLAEIALRETDHFRLLREFFVSPEDFIATMLEI
ncbi:AAA family ATPase [Methylovirgula sp. 4M-Z18]|uniref:AAA family ATPase n=1 Tax=Methylovirgula sp. 4M-Z18 TaxID=2293567 RepID=UPI000E2FBF44|nr:AAA family ATPase [Methylovirgula sp. 4M-Z18]RFB80622.1 ATP-binding protein [Methylovirgula sp. 4M-Z18]